MELWRKELLPSIHKEIHEELRPILQETNEVKNECNEIQKSQKFLAEKYDNVMSILQTTKKQIADVEQTTRQHEKKIVELETISNDHNAIMDDMQQYMRRDCIE